MRILLPSNSTASQIRSAIYMKQLKKLADDTREDLIERNKQIEEGVFTATNDPRRPHVAPRKEDVPPHLNFAPLENAFDALISGRSALPVRSDKAAY